jgi:hypothetical protein
MTRSIADVQRKLKTFDSFARHSSDTKALQKRWQALFGTNLTDLSAKSFVTHYREMRSKSTRGHKGNKKSRRGRRTQYGGVAPLNYVMTPGADVSVYGRFPVEVNTDPGSIRDLDVYFQNALTLGCGNTKYDNNVQWPQVPANMGSNQVGGRRHRKRRTVRKGRKGRKTQRQQRRQHGGDIFGDIGNLFSSGYTSITGSAPQGLDGFSRPFATVYPNPLQQAYTAYSGEVPGKYPADPSPEKHAWNYYSKGTSMAIEPQNVSNITADFNKQTTPMLYSPSDPSPTGAVNPARGMTSGPAAGSLTAQIQQAQR